MLDNSGDSHVGFFLLKRKQKLFSQTATEGEAEVGVSLGQTQEDPHSTCSLPENWDLPRTTDSRIRRHVAVPRCQGTEKKAAVMGHSAAS